MGTAESRSRHLLPAPEPRWTRTTDVVVIGSGVAGLTAALRMRAAVGHVTLVTKASLDDGCTRWAQGGVAAALGAGDTPDQHLRDTVLAGVGLCDKDAVRALVTEGPEALRRLIALDTRFDRAPGSTDLLLTREGGHHRRRIVHAGGDATGAEISRALTVAVCADPGIDVVEHAQVIDLVTDFAGHAAGVTLRATGSGRDAGVGAVHARAVVLATGGLGQVFSATTNPAVATGDGIALALRAGAEAMDLEFVQFHPTVLWLGPDAQGRQPLISEAVRGEGARLVDAAGVRFMAGQHELEELAPRDVVSKAVTRRMRDTGTDHVFLDARHLGAEFWQSRFPTILASCRSHGIDPVTEPIPVAPAAHYASGGIRTDLYGRTTLPGLYACGEVACTGVHGANRLASNSLLEGLVFAHRVGGDLAARYAAGDLPRRRRAVGGTATTTPLPAAEARTEIQRLMTTGAGVLRSAAGLSAAAQGLADLATTHSGPDEPEDARAKMWEAANLHLVATALVHAASQRRETRGCHWREDFPDRDDSGQRRRLVTELDPTTGIPRPRWAQVDATSLPLGPKH